MSELLQDVRYGVRALGKSPGFTAVAIATLAIGIGANTAIFSFVDGVLLKPLPYDEPERIVRVLEKPPGGGRNGISTLNFLDWQKENTVFEYLAAQTGGSVTLTGVDDPVRLRGARVSARYFDIFGIKPVLGRAFADGEDQPGRGDVAVLSHSLWASQFGSDRNVLGRSILLDGKPTTIVGVLPEGGAFDRSSSQIWRPLAFEPQNLTRNYRWLGALARLKRGVTLKQAQAQMDGAGARIAREYPDSNRGWGVAVDALSDSLVGKEMKQSLYVLLAAVGMVLLIGCANLANLTLARGTAREREVAIRLSLGAGRWRLVRQFLTETTLLSIGGGVLGLALGYVTLNALKTAMPPFFLPAEANVTLDGRTLAFALAVSALTGILFGLLPALRATRINLAATIREGGHGASAAGGRQRARAILVVSELALAFVLLTSAGLLIRSFFEMMRVDPGFDSTNVITAGLPVSEKRFPDVEALKAYQRQVVAAIAAIPGVRDVALTSALPLQGWGYGMPFQIAERPMVDRANREACFFKMVTPNYFRALGITLRKGRTLSERDAKGTPPAAVINDTMARKYFPNEDPLGKRILIQEIVPGKRQLGDEIPWEVVGVVGDEKVNGLDDKGDNPGVYVSNQQSPVFYQSLAIRTGIDPSSLYQAVRKAVHAIDKDQSLADMRTLEQIKTESLAPDRLRLILLVVFASIAALLAAVGIYGVVSYAVAQRTHEIGIRGALGAGAGDIVRLILRYGMTMAAAGLAIGLAGALAATRLFSAILFGVGARDPLTMALTGAGLAAVALLACFLPALRAGRVDPMAALRHE